MKKLLCLLLMLTIPALELQAQESAARVKYIFLLIGDGMGPSQRKLPELVTGEKLLLNQLPVSATTQTASANKAVTDSAAAGTALSCGVKTNNGVLGLDPAGTRLESVAEFAMKQGYKIGALTSTTLNHATPAAFYAHVSGRGLAGDISADMARSNFTFFGGGTLDADKGSKPAYDLLRQSGYNVLNLQTPQELAAAVITGKTYIYRPFGEVQADAPKKYFTLADLTTKAIAALDNPSGFFIMVEGGQIDWRCHSNCASGAVAETLDFNEVVKAAYSFYEKHPQETLIVVTADHETGGLKITDNEKFAQLRTQNPEQLKHFFSAEVNYTSLKNLAKKLRDEKADFAKVQEQIQKNLDVSALSEQEITILRQAWNKDNNEKEQKMLYANHEPLAVAAQRIIYARLGIEWSTFGHSATDVITTSVGIGADKFAGSYQNTHIPQTIKYLMSAPQK